VSWVRTLQSRQQDRKLVLQLRFLASLIVGCAGLHVVRDAPVDPIENEPRCSRWDEDEIDEQVSYCLNGDAKLRRAVQEGAPTRRGLLSFHLPASTLPIDVRSRSALSFARKASAAMTRLMWRCHACQDLASQWSRPSSSLAVSKHVSIVHRNPATPGQLCKADVSRREHNVVGALARTTETAPY
jgi:hypothetical protein